jgi:hypothetical protein
VPTTQRTSCSGCRRAAARGRSPSVLIH